MDHLQDLGRAGGGKANFGAGGCGECGGCKGLIVGLIHHEAHACELGRFIRDSRGWIADTYLNISSFNDGPAAAHKH